MVSLSVCNFIFLAAVLLTYCNAEGHFQNVALGKHCTQSSYHGGDTRHECGAAINGNTSGIYTPGPNCIHTVTAWPHDWNPSWEVYLGQSYPIHHIVVWGRNEGDALVRMSGCQIKVDGNLCYTFGAVSVNDSQSFDITCSPPRSGQVIRLEKITTHNTLTEWRDEYSINMCEFEVYAHYAVDGQWGLWGPYDACSQSCGGGSQTRRRSCDRPAPANGGSHCPGDSTETVSCNTQGCQDKQQIGNWGAWGSYSPCSATCGGGYQARTRQCEGGTDCPGSGTQTQQCNTNQCPSWGQWGTWGTCSETCGGGSQYRTRQCYNSNNGACTGSNTETRTCNEGSCPVRGQWGPWGSYGTCSKTCGGGSQSRTRQCDSPPPANGGADCSGNDTETQDCNAPPCPVNGQWGQWPTWGTCSKTCGGGSQSRSRQCDNPPPTNNGANCRGNDTETQDCNALSCQVEGSEPQTAVPVVAIAIGSAVGGVVVTAAIAAVIFIVFVRRRGRDTHDASGTDVDRHAHGKTSSATSPEGGTTTNDNYEDVTDLVPTEEFHRRTNPDSSAADYSADYSSTATSSATAATTRDTMYQNVGDDAAANYESLDVSTIGLTSVYTKLKKPKK